MSEGAILIVDDDEEFASELRAQLQDYRVEIASNTAAAWDLFETRLFDCILLDVQFPGGPRAGLDLLKRIKEQSERTKTKTVIISGIVDDDGVALAFDKLADDVLKKPVGVKELRSRIARLTGKLQVDDPHIRIDIAGGTAIFDGRPMTLTKQEFQVLRFFFEHGKGTDWDLAAYLSDSGRDVSYNDAAVRTAIWRLRSQLRKYSSHEYIRRYRAPLQAGGYQFVTAPRAPAESNDTQDVLARWRSPEGLDWPFLVHELSRDIAFLSFSVARVRKELGTASTTADRLENRVNQLAAILHALQKEHLQ